MRGSRGGREGHPKHQNWRVGGKKYPSFSQVRMGESTPTPVRDSSADVRSDSRGPRTLGPFLTESGNGSSLYIGHSPTVDRDGVPSGTGCVGSIDSAQRRSDRVSRSTDGRPSNRDVSLLGRYHGPRVHRVGHRSVYQWTRDPLSCSGASVPLM